MAQLTTKALRRLWPNGRRIQPTGDADALVEALGDSLDRPRAFARAVLDEADPATSTALIDEWLALLGISVPADMGLGKKQAIAAEALTAIGGQSLDYINGRVQSVFPSVYLDESAGSVSDGIAGLAEAGAAEVTTLFSSAFAYYVRGFYPYASDFQRLLAMLQKTAPAHLQAIFTARAVYDGDVARCGIGSTGRAITGRGTTAYTITNGKIGRSGVGVTGAAYTGRAG